MLRNITRTLKRSGPKTNLLINSPRGSRPVLQLAHGLSLQFPDQITVVLLLICPLVLFLPKVTLLISIQISSRACTLWNICALQILLYKCMPQTTASKWLKLLTVFSTRVKAKPLALVLWVILNAFKVKPFHMTIRVVICNHSTNIFTTTSAVGRNLPWWARCVVMWVWMHCGGTTRRYDDPCYLSTLSADFSSASE